MPLTDVLVRNAEAGKKAARLFDGRGLYLEVSQPAAMVAVEISLRGQGKAVVPGRLSGRRSQGRPGST